MNGQLKNGHIIITMLKERMNEWSKKFGMAKHFSKVAGTEMIMITVNFRNTIANIAELVSNTQFAASKHSLSLIQWEFVTSIKYRLKTLKSTTKFDPIIGRMTERWSESKLVHGNIKQADGMVAPALRNTAFKSNQTIDSLDINEYQLSLLLLLATVTRINHRTSKSRNPIVVIIPFTTLRKCAE